MLLLYVIWAPKNTYPYKRTWNVQERIPCKLHQTAGGSRPPKNASNLCNLSTVLLPRVEVMNISGVFFLHRKSWPWFFNEKKNIYDKNQEYIQWKCNRKFVHNIQPKFNTDLIFVILHTLVSYVNVFWKWHLTHLSKSE